MSLRLLAVLALATSLTACASIDGPDEIAPRPRAPEPATTASVTQGIEQYMQQRARVESVGFRLRRAAEPECRKQNRTRNDLGLVVWSLASFPNADDQARLRGAYGLDNSVTVAIAIEGAPAHRSGLRQGDVITHVNGEALPVGTGATERFIARSNAAARSGAVTIRVADGRVLSVAPDAVCDYPALLVRSPDTNAAADGASFAITTALYDLTRSDDELAVILGHELAHNILGHLASTTPSGGSSTGRLLEAFTRSSISAALSAAATPAHDPKKEIEADRVGLELMSRAGFNVTAADTMWTRLNAAGNATLISRTHPTGTDRQAALRKAISDLKTR